MTLEAVATDLAAVANPSTLTDAVNQTMTKQILRHLTDNILDREADKMRDQLDSISRPTRLTLFSPLEQLERLAAIVLGMPAPDLPPGLTQLEMNAYDNALRSLLPQHPFLDGTGREPSGAVFSAVINAHALFSASRKTSDAAEVHAGRGSHTPNPFLTDFYLDLTERDGSDTPVVPPEHIVLLYESVRARASAGDVVRLSIESDENEESLDVEIQISGLDSKDRLRRLLFKSSQAGQLRFGRQVNGVAVEAPALDVVIGSGDLVEFIVPVSLNVGRLSFNCSGVIVQLGEKSGSATDATATIEAAELLKSNVKTSPIVRAGAERAVCWPGANAYPWTHFAVIPSGETADNIDDTLRGIRRLVLAFRSHSKGRLARFEDKIEHRRITKGSLGVAIRERMMRDGVLTREGNMYFLDPVALGKATGATYQDMKLKRFNALVKSYGASITVSA